MNKLHVPDLLIFGELLYDCFPNSTPKLGGAPFNVAWHLQGFGLQPNMISAVGNDDLGKQALSAMQDWGMNAAHVHVTQDFPTGVVNVAIHDGEPSYDIQNNVAYDNIPVTDDLLTTLNKSDDCLVYHGTLATRNAASRDTLLKVKDHRRCFIDVNLRDPWWDKEFTLTEINNGHFVKLNFDELITLSDAHDPTTMTPWQVTAEQFKAEFNIANLLITRGSEGATLIDVNNEAFSVEPLDNDMPVVSTVGAGDAFSSIVILGYLNEWPWEITLERAQQFASYIVTQEGATSNNQEIYKGFAALWHIEEVEHV